MANPISEQIQIGTVGELLVQLRLLQYGIQAAPPLKDSGNDLIALKGKVCKTIQIKTTFKKRCYVGNIKDKNVDLLFLVFLERSNNNNIQLDSSQIFILTKNDVNQETYSISSEKIKDKKISQKYINKLFQ